VSGDGILSEYMVSLRATLAAFRNLSGEVPVEMFDVGPFKHSEYDDLKVEAVNRCKPKLAIEIHCNGGPPARNYGEVIYHRKSAEGMHAAQDIAQALKDGFSDRHKWPNRGARVNTIAEDNHLMFFLERTNVPAVIVEGLFLSNLEQAAWLAGDGGCEAYGLLVAEGVRKWLKGAKA
jgi:N-acetylmuramoyl-L-alanine amidase